MKVKQIGEETKTKEVLVSCHGCSYRITSDFKGLRIEKVDELTKEYGEIRILPRSSSSIIIC
jgi:hypothetical protein